DYTSRRLYRYDLSDYIHRYGAIMVMSLLLLIAVIIIVVLRYHEAKREHEEKLQRMIDYDQLTGALSLTGFRKKAEELLRNNPDKPYILTYVNFRNFKYINESLGRDQGDNLLKYYVDITKSSLKDYEAVCRLEADHFVVLSCAESDEIVIGKDENFIDQVRNYFIDRGKDNRVQVCGGIYFLTPLDYLQPDIDRMIDNARVAEKKVAFAQKQNYVFYNPEQWEKGKHAADVIDHLPSAIKAGHFKVWYQPQIDYETGIINGAEALCRWDHSKLGFMQPSEFITTLEEAHLIYELDSFVWDKVCQDLKRWNDLGHHRSISVNVSRCDFLNNNDIPAHFRKLIESYGLTPDQLRIEITETAYVENPELLINTTEKLQEYGFKVEMDDFGSGYSSLHMLKEVPVDRIKLDLRFLTEEGDAEKSGIIVSHIVKMIRSLNMELISEGVETKEQAEFLKSQGNNEMQGYYFYRPMPAEEFEKLIIR
ncbi:MAG: GGDEF domain-containing protein, partial [Firmicutes bacterium]|nr:GGDEF domain-containing protein [Bacillota bacterium]